MASEVVNPTGSGSESGFRSKSGSDHQNEDSSISENSGFEAEKNSDLASALRKSFVKKAPHDVKWSRDYTPRDKQEWIMRQFLKESFWKEEQKKDNKSEYSGWRVVQVQNFGVNTIARLKPKPEGAIRIVCISDTHSAHFGFYKPKTKAKCKISGSEIRRKLELWKSEGYSEDFIIEKEEIEEEGNSWLPDGDVLLHAGDFSAIGTNAEVYHFCEFLDKTPHKFKVVVAGNHDVVLETNWYATKWSMFHSSPVPESERLKEELRKHCIYLEDDLAEIHIGSDLIPGLGDTKKILRLYGTPWQTPYNDWAFNIPEQSETGELSMEDIAQAIPPVDILLSHSPPSGCGRLERNRLKNPYGSQSLEHAVRRITPALHVFGHIHEGYGVLKQKYTDAKGRAKTVTFVNACNVDTKMRLFNNPLIIDIEPK